MCGLIRPRGTWSRKPYSIIYTSKRVPSENVYIKHKLK